MSRTKGLMIGSMTVGLTMWMCSAASAQLFRRSETREPRYQPQPEFQGQLQRGDQYRGEVRYETGERYVQSSQMSPRIRHRRVSALIGATTRGPNGEHLGRVEDLIASESGCIDYAIVSFSGIPGLGTRLAAIPWTIADLDMSRRVVTLDIDRERIREAPIFFDRNNWPDLYDRNWSERVSDYFGVELAEGAREFARERVEGRMSRSRSRDQDRDRYESRSYGRPESEWDRDRSEPRARRGSDRDEEDYRPSRRSQDSQYDQDRSPSRSRSEAGRYEDRDRERDEDYRSSRESQSDDENNSSRQGSSRSSDKSEDDSSDDSSDDRPQ